MAAMTGIQFWRPTFATGERHRKLMRSSHPVCKKEPTVAIFDVPLPWPAIVRFASPYE
jgi:hypothetical protein